MQNSDGRLRLSNFCEYRVQVSPDDETVEFPSICFVFVRGVSVVFSAVVVSSVSLLAILTEWRFS